MQDQEAILKIENMNKRFGKGCSHCQDSQDQLVNNFCPHCGTVYACRNINLELYPGEILGIVGESGSGKSTLMQSLYFDQDVTSGTYLLKAYKEGQANLYEANIYEQKKIRNNLLGMVYQNPILGLRMDYSSIANIAEKMIAAGNRNVESMKARGKELLEKVDISPLRAKEAPKNFSGGMQQRVQIAKALSNKPPILLLDEVTTGLDLSVQADVLDLIKTIQRDLKISMIIVSHDLAVIRMLADRTIVMHKGVIIEEGLTDQILEDPQDAYTQQLVYSLI
ncbi:MAG: ATP-binding cassette domain-containing protein [Bacillota bacterium]|nr:ATP-binding cassette domain-containing protein [Bacillota bacterium]